MNRAILCERIVFSNHPGQEMKKIREELNLPQNDFAHALGITPQALSTREIKRKDPGVRVVKLFIETLGKAKEVTVLSLK
ncbi:MAG TPA: helix-turn-helix domain-containing protein [archaeon]|nr:helix-turn-helix domain-containing protein [archaeon]